MEKSERGEDVMGFIVILIGLFNVFIGYRDRIKPLPAVPWAA